MSMQPPNNFERMMALVTEFFDTKNDPEQISVSEDERDKLQALHPATLSELANENGPIVWILVVPVAQQTMQRFVNGTISEKQLLEETRPGGIYDAVYLCSAAVLPEFRKKGLAKKVTIAAIDKIRQEHPIKALFFWAFSEEGRGLATSVAKETGLPLFERK